MKRAFAFSLIVAGFIFQGSLALSQEANADDYNAKFSSLAQEVSVGCGVLLPNNVPGITEVMSLCGGRYGFKVGQQTVLETSFFDGNGSAQSYILAGEDFRYDMPLDDLMASFYAGVDLHYSTSATYDVNGLNSGTQNHIGFGVDAGTAIWVPFSDSFNFRADLKLLLNPGTSLFLGASFVFRFDSSSGGGS